MTKDSEPKQHHYIPRFYLQGFSDRGFGHHRGRVYVVDLHEARCFYNDPKNIAKIRDYNTVVDDVGQPDLTVEKKILGEIDGEASRVIGEIESSKRLPTEKDLRHLCLFVASLQVRVPRFRQMNHEINQHGVDIIASNMLRTVDDFEAGRAHFEATTGQTFELSYHDAKKLLPEASEVEIPRTENIFMMLGVMPEIAEVAATMTPHLLVADGNDQFVTSDNPVNFYDTNDERREAGLESVAWASDDVEVGVPLTKNCYMAFDRQDKPSVLQAKDFCVANCNALTIRRASQFVFSPVADFPFLAFKKDVLRGADEAFRLCPNKKDQYGIAIAGGPVGRRPPKPIRR